MLVGFYWSAVLYKRRDAVIGLAIRVVRNDTPLFTELIHMFTEPSSDLLYFLPRFHFLHCVTDLSDAQESFRLTDHVDKLFLDRSAKRVAAGTFLDRYYLFWRCFFWGCFFSRSFLRCALLLWRCLFYRFFHCFFHRGRMAYSCPQLFECLIEDPDLFIKCL